MKSILFNLQVAIALLCCEGCLDRGAAAESACSIQYTEFRFACGGGAQGVSLLVAVDTSSSMANQQDLVSKNIYSLVNVLTTLNPDNFGYLDTAISDIRVAVVSSDLGLMFGEDHAAGGTDEALGCTDADGDLGEFLKMSGSGEVCLNAGSEYAATELCEENDQVSNQAMCLSSQSANGCEVEQTLESALIGIEGHPDFIGTGYDRVFALVVISDEDDFSIEDGALLETASWKASPNIAGSYPASNSDYLFPTSRYFERFSKAALSAYPLFFGAVIGVPTKDECQGDGDRILENGCLDLAEMQITPSDSSDDTDGLTSLNPACIRTDPDSGKTISATPGRRYVELAEAFGQEGYVGSICNDDMETMMKTMASHIWAYTFPMCWWKRWPFGDTENYIDMADCMQSVHYVYDINSTEDCPAELYAGFSREERLKYESLKSVRPIKNSAGKYEQKEISCVLPKLPLPLDCKEAAAEFNEHYSDYSGWYYCENNAENTEGLCTDRMDNDGDGLVDCDDDKCAACDFCGGKAECPLSPHCGTQLEITAAALRATQGNYIYTYCLRHTALEGDCAMK